MKIKSEKFGFTLIEIMIAVGIFAILTMVIAGIYVAFSNSQVRTQAAQKTLNDAQYALEVMAREIRNSSIYYGEEALCPTVGGYDSCLRLQKTDGTIIVFLANSNLNQLFYAVSEGGESWHSSETISKFNIISLDFITNPDSDNPANDPFIINSSKNQQPRVTIKLVVRPAGVTRDIEQVTYVLQTTVSSRVYQR